MAGYTEILDANHHEHKVYLVRKDEPYCCAGCGELGFELRYACRTDKCSHQYHRPCMQPLNTIVTAPFYKHDFYFLKPAPSCHSPRCEACTKEVKGYMYYCPAEGVSLHPCCADLPRVIDAEGTEMKLKREITKKCSECHEKNVGSFKNSWAYVSNNKIIQLHVACVRKALVSQFETREFGDGKAPRRLSPKPPPPAETASSSSLALAASSSSSFPRLEVAKYRKSKPGVLETIRKVVKAVIATIMAVITGNSADLYKAFAEYFGLC